MNKFSEYLYNYFDSYLVEVIKASSNTIETYKYAFIKLFKFFKEEKNIKSDNIRLEMLNISTIEEFIKWMNNQGLGAKTINNRITAIKIFVQYISIRDLKYLTLYNQIKEIKRLKEEKTIIKYLNEEEMGVLFSNLNYRNKKELKTLALLILLYECALRVNELCNLRVQDIDFNKSEIIILYGKGKKIGIVPITSKALKTIQLYINTYNKNPQDYIFTNNRNEKYTRWGIKYILDKEISKAKNQRPDLFTNKISPHKIRHSRAMNLLNNKDNPVPLTTIQKLLRHNDLKTTQIYAESSPEIVRDAIERNAKDLNIKRRYNTKKENQLEEWLKKSLNH